MKQTEYFGAGTIFKLPEIIKEIEAAKIFFITGRRSFELSGAKDKIKKMFQGHEIEMFSVSGNPDFENIKVGLEKFLRSGCDAIVAVGGGSVIDSAKAINVISKNSADAESLIKGKLKPENPGNPLIAVPTTAGSGSEATHFAVVYIGKEKFSLADERVLPAYSVNDPELTYTLNAQDTANSGIDAFAQAVESYWSVNSDAVSRSYSEKSIDLILKNLEKAVVNPDKESRENMMRAANYSGKAINVTKTTAPHAASYSLTSYFNVPHGQAVSITLGEFLEYNSKVSEDDKQGNKSSAELKNAIEGLIKILGCSSVEDAKGKITSLMKAIGLKTRLSELNIGRDQLNLITDNINLERLQNNPRKLTRDGFGVILNNILN